MKMPMIVTPRASHCFSSLIWLSRNKFYSKISFLEKCWEFLRIFTSRSRSRSILISLFTSRKRVKAFWFHFALLEKSESILFSLCTSRKRVKAFYFHFSLLELQKPTLAGPWSRQKGKSSMGSFWMISGFFGPSEWFL